MIFTLPGFGMMAPKPPTPVAPVQPPPPPAVPYLDKQASDEAKRKAAAASQNSRAATALTDQYTGEGKLG